MHVQAKLQNNRSYENQNEQTETKVCYLNKLYEVQYIDLYIYIHQIIYLFIYLSIYVLKYLISPCQFRRGLCLHILRRRVLLRLHRCAPICVCV